MSPTLSLMLLAGIDWRTDLDAARREADESGRPVLAYLHAPWCDYSLRMDAETWANPDVAACVAATFVPLSLDASSPPRFGITGTPATLILAPDGDPAAVLPGFVEAGPLREWLASALERSRAALDLDRQSDASPDDAVLHARRGLAWADLNVPARARPALERAVEGLSDAALQADVLTRLSGLLLDDDADRARDLAVRAAALDPENALGRWRPARIAEALALFRQRSIAEALDALDAVLARSPDDADNDRVLWIAALGAREFSARDRAAAYVERLLRDHPDSRYAPPARAVQESLSGR